MAVGDRVFSLPWLAPAPVGHLGAMVGLDVEPAHSRPHAAAWCQVGLYYSIEGLATSVAEAAHNF